MPTSSAAEKRIIIRNVRVFDGIADKLTDNADVLIEGTHITAVSTSPIGDETGRETSMGNANGYLDFVTGPTGLLFANTISEAKRMLLRGFTTVRDMGGDTAPVKTVIDRGDFAGPRIFPSQAMISQTSGHADFAFVYETPLPFGGDQSRTDSIGFTRVADGVDRVLAAVREQLRKGASQIKLTVGEGAASMYDPLYTLQFTPEEIRAAVQAAEDYGTYVATHVYTQEKQELASTLAQPVQLKEQYTNEAPTFGTGFSPFFMSLALFVGGIITWMLLTPLQSRPIVQGLSPLRVVLASYAPAFLIGFVPAAILYAVVTFGVGLRAVHPIATFAFLLLVVAAFMAIIQMFNAAFGTAVGRVVTLAFLMLQLVSAGGIYPVQTTAKPFQYLHHVDPMTYTVNGLRELTVGGIDYRLWVAIAVLTGITVGCLAISSWSARRNRQYTMDRLYPPVEV